MDRKKSTERRGKPRKGDEENTEERGTVNNLFEDSIADTNFEYESGDDCNSYYYCVMN